MLTELNCSKTYTRARCSLRFELARRIESRAIPAPTQQIGVSSCKNVDTRYLIEQFHPDSEVVSVIGYSSRLRRKMDLGMASFLAVAQELDA